MTIKRAISGAMLFASLLSATACAGDPPGDRVVMLCNRCRVDQGTPCQGNGFAMTLLTSSTGAKILCRRPP